MKKTIIALAIAGLTIATANAADGMNSLSISPVGVFQPAEAEGDRAVAIGTNATAGTTRDGNPLLVISPLWTYNAQLAVGDGSTAWGAGDAATGTGAIAVSQPALGQNGAASAYGYGATAWGNNSSAFGAHSAAGTFAPGTVPTTNPTIYNATAIGSYSVAGATNSTAVGQGAQAYATNSVALGAGTVATRDNSVSVGSRQITEVSAGTAATDAVNKAQLDAVAAMVGMGDVALNRVMALENTVSQNRKIAAAGTATALAMASGRGVSLAPGETALTLGTGSYDGQGAVAVSVAHNLDIGSPKEIENNLFKEIVIHGGVGAAPGVGGPGLSAGVSFKF